MKKQLLALVFSCFVLWGCGDALAAKPTEWSLLGENKSGTYYTDLASFKQEPKTPSLTQATARAVLKNPSFIRLRQKAERDGFGQRMHHGCGNRRGRPYLPDQPDPGADPEREDPGKEKDQGKFQPHSPADLCGRLGKRNPGLENGAQKGVCET